MLYNYNYLTPLLPRKDERMWMLIDVFETLINSKISSCEMISSLA